MLLFEKVSLFGERSATSKLVLFRQKIPPLSFRDQPPVNIPNSSPPQLYNFQRTNDCFPFRSFQRHFIQKQTKIDRSWKIWFVSWKFEKGKFSRLLSDLRTSTNHQDSRREAVNWEKILWLLWGRCGTIWDDLPLCTRMETDLLRLEGLL